ncbi:PAPP1 protein, partial [Locustella ochotensis]|nr:PAPP1 protein [Locustella ochotensis]
GLYDKCSYTSRDRGWVLGINTVSDQGNRDPRYFFSLKTDRARKVTTIAAHRSYLPNQWVHLAATYDGRLMRLYVNGAQVATSGEQVGSIFSPLTLKCKVLMLGGNALNQNYRGYVEHFSLWRTARSQKEILLDMEQAIHRQDTPLPQLVLQDSLLNVKSTWSPMKDGSSPQTKFSYHHGYLLDTSLDPPLCGQTVCDNTDVIASYNKLPRFRRNKTVRYRVVNLYDDQHQNPTVSQQQIEFQHQHLNEAFSRYNITWELEVLEVKNSSLRHRLILANCDISKIGDENCDPECNHTLTGYDGGDCRHVRHTLFNKKKQNGVCDMDCNYERYNFDGGECCNPEITEVTKTCFDPYSPYRRNSLSLDSLFGCTFAELKFTAMMGVCTQKGKIEQLGLWTYPWSLAGILAAKPLLTTGVKIQTLCLALVLLSASSPERQISKLISDKDQNLIGTIWAHFASPAPLVIAVIGQESSVPSSADIAPQQRRHWRAHISFQVFPLPKASPTTAEERGKILQSGEEREGRKKDEVVPIKNFPELYLQGLFRVFLGAGLCSFHTLSVSSCSQLFTKQRLFIKYFCPLEPTKNKSTEVSSNSRDPYGLPNTCWKSPQKSCPGDRLSQHPHVCPKGSQLFISALTRGKMRCTSSGTQSTAVRSNSGIAPSQPRLAQSSGTHRLWRKIRSMCSAGVNEILSFSLVRSRFAILKFLGVAQLRLPSLHVISALQITINLQEVVFRFINNGWVATPPECLLSASKRIELSEGTTYRYQVVIVSGMEESEPSPALVYVSGSGYCGDGIIQIELGEECDDMNKINGDGCSLFCLQELSFNCIDEPSRCYFHDGDGVCEEFEQMTSIKDCGVYTPKGFLDQWASNVSVSHHSDQQCPGWVVIGQPAATQMCRTKVIDLNDGVSQYAWYPCTANFQYSHMTQTIFWLKAYFSQPMVAAAVLVHLVTDGTYYLDQKQETIGVQLFDTKEQSHDLGVHVLSCRNNPLIIPVIHDLSHPFYHTQAVLISFSSQFVAISGVALRSFHNFDPITISSCQQGQTYSPAEQSCVHYSCQATDCKRLEIENAVLSCTGGTGWDNGAQCNVSCRTGYILQIHRDDELVKSQTESSVTMTCVDGKWNKQVTCEPVDCGVPDQYHVYPATFNCSEGTTFGKKCSFTCRPPALLKGNNSNLTCMEDGLWSFPEALCELMCRAPSVVPNADLQTSRCREDKHKVGSFCKYKCKPGYHVPGSSRKSRKRAFKIQCTQDGTWLPGACVPVTCDPPPSKFHGLYQCSNGFQFNSECRIKCEDDDSQAGRGSNVIHCRKDGTWSGSFHLCREMQGQCALPTQLNSHLKLQCAGGYGIGTECTTSCLDHSHEPILLRVNETVQDIQHWMNPQRVKSVVCTAGLKWYPHPSLIHCVKGCEPFMGDNYCDSINNRAFCNYDGGDCCASTVKTKKVTPFPMSCDLQGECACRDPNAQEHNQKDLRGFSLG